MKRRLSLLLAFVVCLCLFSPALGAETSDEEAYLVVIENGLILRDIIYHFTAGGPEAQYNPGAIGSIAIDFRVYGPSVVCRTQSLAARDKLPDEGEIEAMIKRVVEEDRNHPYPEAEIDFPFVSGTGTKPIWPEDVGKTKYLIVFGLDKNNDETGYAVIRVRVTDTDGEVIDVSPYPSEKEDTFAALSPAPSTNYGRNNYTASASPIRSNLHRTEEGYLRAERFFDQLIVEKYSTDFEYLSSKTVDMEVKDRKIRDPVYNKGYRQIEDGSWQWGGLYFGENYVFIVIGWDNLEENDDMEVVRILKYDYDFNYLSEASVYGINTTVPFIGGCLRFAETGELLYVRTCHQMYKSDDGIRHQANMTIKVNTAETVLYDNASRMTSWTHMSAAAYCGVGSFGYVSHSFNQFILIDEEERIVMLDQGDGYPRAAFLQRFELGPEGWYEPVGAAHIQDFPGAIGDNTTGASLGGLGETETGYITAYNYNGRGADSSGIVMGVVSVDPNPTRNIYFSYTPKSDCSDSATTVRQITDYPDGGQYSAGTPTVVQTAPDSGFVIWDELERNKYGTYAPNGTISFVSYTGKGELGKIETYEGRLSDCQPIAVDGKAVWYATDHSAPVFYVLESSGLTAYPVLEPEFEDVSSDAYYYDAVLWAVRSKITNGTSETTFSPDRTVTRSEAVTFLWRAAGCPEPLGTLNPFSDVSDNSYYYQAVLWAVEKGITNGTTDTTFSPSNQLTHGQILTFLWRLEGRPGETGIGKWYKDAENWAKSRGLLSETTMDDSMEEDCPRRDVVTYMHRIMNG